MRVAFLVNSFPLPLSQTFILNQITGLIDRGHEVDIYAGWKNPLKKHHPDIDAYKLSDRVFYRSSMPEAMFLRRAKAAFLFLINIYRAPQSLLNSLNYFKYGEESKSLNLFYSSMACLTGRRSYDIINCHFGWQGNLAVLLRDLGVIQGKVVTTFHGLDITKDIAERGEDIYRNLFIKGELFLPISHNWKQKLISLGCEGSKIKVHHMGIDCTRFRFRQRHIQKDRTIQIASVSRLVEKKGIEYGIRAIAKLSAKNIMAKYVVIGDGPLREDLENLIESLKVGDFVDLVGWKKQDEVIDILNYSHILLAPSVTAPNGDQEGIPVVIMEAMAMGLPVISTLHSGIPELVKNGVSGFLVPERDFHALAEKVDCLIENPRTLAEICTQGRKSVESEFNIEKLNDSLVDIYKNLLSE